MNPDAWQLALRANEIDREDRRKKADRARLHKAAVARRKKAKRGGPQ